MDGALQDALALARTRWPELGVSPEALLNHLAALPAAARSAANLVDVILACACLQGDTAALLILDHELIAPATAQLQRNGFPHAVADDAAQLGRMRLLMPAEEGSPPALATYQGTGPLRSFVQVMLAHVAARQASTRKDHDSTSDEDELLGQMGVTNVERALLRDEQQDVIRRSVSEVLVTLSPRERAMLRFHLIDGLEYASIASIYGVSRATAVRWVGAARQKLAQGVRASVVDELGKSGLAELALSKIDLSLSRLLG